MDSAELNLQLLTSRMILVSLVFLIVTGSFGSVCNIIIFSSKDLKNNPCALYLLCTAVFELLILNFGIISRLASDNFGSTLLFQSTIYCKTRSYLTTAISVTATYLVLLACVDRCMSTSTNVRQRAFSRVQVARWSAATTIVIGMIINFHSFIFFEIKIVCLPRPGVYALFYSIYLIVCASVVPNVLMIVCSAGTIRNLRKARLRIANAQLTGSSQQRRLKRLEDQLILVSHTFSLRRTGRCSRTAVDYARPGILVDRRRCGPAVALHLLFPHY